MGEELSVGKVTRPRMFIFGSYTLSRIPQQVVDSAIQYAQSGWEIATLDGDGISNSIHNELTIVGLRDSCVVYGIDKIHSNRFEVPEVIVNTKYDGERVHLIDVDGTELDSFAYKGEIAEIKKERYYYEFIPRKLATTCGFGVCIWDGKTSRENMLSNMLSAIGKPCYLFSV